MEIRDSEMSLVFFILYICKMKKLMKEKNQVVPDEVLRGQRIFLVGKLSFKRIA